MKKQYCLISEKWIPCQKTNGESDIFSLKEVLIDYVDQIQFIFHKSPLITLSVYRLLIAIIQSAIRGPEDTQDVIEYIRQNKTWDDKLKNYFEKWEDRFYLIHEKYPFFQHAEIEIEKAEVPLTHIMREQSSGSNATYFDHSVDKVPQEYSLARASLEVVCAQICSFSSGQGYRQSLATTSGASVFVEGNSLRETLSYNLFPYKTNESHGFIYDEDDCPSWEMDDPKKQKEFPGYLGYMTYISRNILLQPEVSENGTTVVKYLLKKPTSPIPHFSADFKLVSLDPFTRYESKKKKSEKGPDHKPVSLEKDYVVWQSFPSLVQLVWGKIFRDIACKTICDYNDIPLKLLLLGVNCNNDKINYWGSTRIPLPKELLKDEQIIPIIKKYIDIANKINFTLKKSIYGLLSSEEKSESNRADDKSSKKKRESNRASVQFLSETKELFFEYLTMGNIGDKKLEWISDLGRISERTYVDYSKGACDVKKICSGKIKLSKEISKLKKEAK